MKKICIFPSDPLKAYFKKGEIKPRYFNPCNFFDEVHILSPCKQDVEEDKVKAVAGKAKLKIYPIGRFTLFGFFFYRTKVLRLVKKIKPDVIRAYDPLVQGYLAVYCGKKLKIPTVISIHVDQDEERRFKKFGLFEAIKNYFSRKFVESYSLRNADKVICVTNFLTSYAKKYGAKIEDIVVIYNRVDTSMFKQRDKNYLFDKPTILCVGRLDKQKNQACLIKAIKDLDVNLLLVGNGELKNRLQQLAKNLNLEDRVKFIESVPYSEINKIYSSAYIFAIASHYEGFCIPVLEAMASSLPVVAPNKEPFPELIGDAGILVQKNDPRYFQEAFQKLLSNPGIRKKLAKKARKRAEKFDGKIMERKEMSLYKKIIKNWSESDCKCR
ncbi:MAG: glycosyltransferase family 4 protein [Candidatus Aenigmatarchaeota archaeon]